MNLFIKQFVNNLMLHHQHQVLSFKKVAAPFTETLEAKLILWLHLKLFQLIYDEI